MKQFILRSLAAITAVVITATGASAAVLGTPNGGWQTDLGGGAVYSNNVFSSDSVGNQTENYVEYKPNAEAVPIVVNGASIYGSRTISSAAEYMRKNGLRPLVGINGDFFSTKTGIPMGYTIIDGKIFSKESGIQDAVGFRKDGTAFIDKIGIDAALAHNGNEIDIQYVNKWPQKGFSCVYMLDGNFSDTTKTDFYALYVICSAVSGDLSLNSSMQLKVDEVYTHNGAIKIPDGKYVFVMDPSGDEAFYSLLSGLESGDTVTFTNSVYANTRHNWNEAEYAISSIGGRLLDNGVAGSDFMPGVAPRTAVGIKGNGNLIFYTIDGRQKGYSYGITTDALAKRMQELGCVDAINLDGGGSTAIGGIFPGSDSFVVSNRPSDKSERKCANYLFLQDLRQKTGIVGYVNWIESDNYNHMAGTSYQIQAKSVFDTNNYKMDSLTGITYTAENEGQAQATVDSNGYVTFKGTGKVKVHISGDAYNKTFVFETYETPQEIRIINESTGEAVEELTVEQGSMINYSLEAAAYVNGVRLQAYPSLFLWESVSDIAVVDEDGTVSIKDNGKDAGTIKVSIGGVVKEIPITVTRKPAFSDTSSHWASEAIDQMAKDGIINGFYENGVNLFKPDNDITRIQYASIVAKSLGVNPSEYTDVKLDFTDADKIQTWALDYVKAMVSLGYMNGRSEDDGKTVYFAPDAPITRAEAFAVMGRTIQSSKTHPLTFADSELIPNWSKEEISKLCAMGVLNGFEDNTIRPHKNISRAEAAVLVKKVMNAH